LNQLRNQTVLDVDQIKGDEMQIHPTDLLELWDSYCFCWPDNAPRNTFKGTRLIADVEAPILSRKAL
jgi:hypothetical protein